jgi:vancomycin resistance protein YoaR
VKENNKSSEEGVTNRTAKDNSQEQQLILFQPLLPEIEEEKHNRFLLWFGQKKVLLTALISMFFFVGSFFILVSYKWVLESVADNKRANKEITSHSPSYIILRLNDKKYELNLNKIGYDGSDIDSIDKSALKLWFDRVKRQVSITPKNAEQHKLGSPIKPEQLGYTVNDKQMSSWLNHPENIINKPQDISLIPRKPTITKAILQCINGKEISSYTTYYDTRNTERTTNLKVASQAINNIVLLPGEIFSFNKIIGERTVKKGYRIARVIVKGEYSEGLGGGISQVSSTLFNSVDEAGLAILQRFSLSPKETFVPAGRDATVQWSGPDFRFKNNLDMPIAIRVQLTRGKLIVKTYSVVGIKIIKKKVKPAPVSISQVSVNSNKTTKKKSRA